VRLITELETGRRSSRNDPVKLDEIVAALLPALRVDAERRRVDLSLDAEPALPRIASDKSLLQELVALTLTSAVRHSEPGQAVRVSMMRRDREIVLAATGKWPDVSQLTFLIARRLSHALGARLAWDQSACELSFERASG
jgi:signal transduction histidine kinase